MKKSILLLLGGLLSAVHVSAQALTWTKRNANVKADVTMNAATYGGGKFAVVGYHGTFINNVNGLESQVSTSTDGVTWSSAVTLPANLAVRDIAYGDGLFFVPVEDNTTSAGSNANRILTSPDAVTWTARNTGAGDLVSVAYGAAVVTGGTAPLYVAVGSANGGNNIATSPNGITWTRVNTGTTVNLRKVLYSKFVFLAMANNTLLRSSNGTTWTAVTVPNLPANPSFLSLANDGTQWLLLVNDSTQKPRVYVSPDASAWAAAGTAFSATLFDGTIASNGTVAAVAGAAASPSGGVVFTAPITAGFFASLGTWSNAQVVDPVGFGLNFITYVNNLWITGGYDAALYTSGSAGTGGGSGTPAPTISTQPVAAQTVTAGASASFSVTAGGTGLAYQWRFNGNAIAGATSASYTLAAVTVANAGSYTVTVTNAGGSLTSTASVLTVNAAAPTIAYLSNASVLARAGTGTESLTVGVTIGGGSGTKSVLIRGIGPTLGTLGVPGVLADPILTIFQGQTQVGGNDDWGSDSTNAAAVSAANTTVGAFPLAAGSKDAALYGTGINAAGYTIQLAGKAGTVGTGLIELYDPAAAATITANTPRVTNVSALTFGGTGSNTLILGFTVGGTGTRRLLIRASGPGLIPLGVAGTMPDPKLELFNGAGTKVDENDTWAAGTLATQNSVGAFAFPANSKDAVLVVTLAPGGYTAQVTAVGGATGVALVEIYELP